MSTEKQLENLINTLKKHAAKYTGVVDSDRVDLYIEDLRLRSEVPGLIAKCESNRALIDHHNRLHATNFEEQLRDAVFERDQLKERQRRQEEGEVTAHVVDSETESKYVNDFHKFLASDPSNDGPLHARVTSSRINKEDAEASIATIDGVKANIEILEKQEEELKNVRAEISELKRALPEPEPQD